MKKRPRLQLLLAGVALVVAVLYFSGVLPVLDARFRPSGFEAYIPRAGESFASYVQQNRQRIRESLARTMFNGGSAPFGSAYPLERVVAMRAPFELGPDPARCDPAQPGDRLGFLLIHGLTDSPYLLSALAGSLAERYACALVRGLLVPGHGTVPGDLLASTLDEWRQVTRYGVEGFRGQVDSLYLVGYSNGSALGLDYLQSHPDDSLVAGLVMLSPGLRAATASIALAPFLRHLLRWAGRGTDDDPAKYDSMTMRSAANFHALTSAITAPGAAAPPVPVLLVVSGEDTTIDSDAAADWFCTRAVPHPRSRLIWYRSPVTGRDPAALCPGLTVVDSVSEDPRFLSHSHVAITMPAADSHYGVDGDYPLCSAYRDDAARFRRCQEDDRDVVFGENNLREADGLYRGRLLRRATFNPLYGEMIEAVACFVAGCDEGN